MKTKQLFLTLLALLTSIGANAYSFKVNGIYYNASGTSATVTYQSYGSTQNGGTVPSGYVSHEQENIIGWDEDDCPIYGTPYYTYYSSDMSGAIVIPSTVTYNGTTYQVTGIANYAFENCSVTSVTIQHSLNDIAEAAFSNYKGSLTINCPLQVYQHTYWDDDGDPYYENYYPFSNCKFTSLTLGSNVTSISYNYFKNNTAMTSLNLPSTLANIGESAFSGCSGITTLTLPSSLTSIGASAFSGCSKLAVLDINTTNITTIGNYAFNNCSKLNTVNLSSIPNWLNCSLSNSASSPFCNGADLYVADEERTTISFPVATTQIPAYAFYGCRNITSVTIPAQVSTIGTQAFGNCPNLTAINVNSNNSNYSSDGGILYNANKTALILCPATKSGDVVIPQSVTSIHTSAFSGCSSLTSIMIPNGVTSIGGSAFSGCSGTLTVNCNIPNASSSSYSPFNGSSFSNVIIGNDVTRIGNYAFYGCTDITSLTLSNTLTRIENSAFYGCTGITSLTLPNTLTSIDNSAFYGCTGITSLTLPNTLTSIGNRAFQGCTGITSLTLSNSLTSIDYAAFMGCTGITSLTLPNTLTSIGANAFYGCPLTSITIPNGVTSIGSSAFSGCSGTLTVNCNIPNASYSYSPFNGSSFSSVIIGNDVTSIGDYAFYGISTITSLSLSNTLTNIGSSAFQGCTGITSLTLPNTLTSIGSSAFQGCTGITSLTLPNTLTSIGSSAFSGCSGTLTVNCNIPNASYSSYSPFNGSSFSRVIIGNAVTSIGNYAFYNRSFTAFICKATTPPALGSYNAFGGSKKIYVPYKSMDAYKSAWSQLSTPTYTYFPLLDVMFFEQQTAASYANELTNKDKSKITSVAFYEGGLDNSLTASVLKDGMNPNCLYYVPSSAGLSGDNIITLDDYETESVTLTDNYTYDCPIPFHAEEIKYVHNPSVWANGSAGWETICLPFAPESFEASERGYISPIMLGSTGNFWLRRFVGASSDAVYFSSTIDGQMEANTPYLVAFPGSSMGTGHLQGQTITFTGSDAYIQVTEQPEVKYNDFIFVGNYDTTADGISGWALDASGSTLTTSNTVGNQPFRAYFKNTAGQASNVKLRIDFSDPTDVRSLRAPSDFKVKVIGDGQLMVQSNNNRTLPIYSVDGRLAKQVNLTAGENHISGLHKGLYIIDNQKFIVR